jgi:hypothetical protein
MDGASAHSTASESLLKYGAPWILSGLGSFFGYATMGNAVAFLLIFGLCACWPSRIKPVEVVLGCSFLLIWIGADCLHVSWLLFCQSYLAPMLLALMAFGSLAIGSPFTLVYAREWVPAHMWNNPHFHRVNRILTALWGAAFLLSAVAKYWNGLPWIELIALNLFIMFLVAYFTKWFPEWYREHVYLKAETKEFAA